MVAFECFTLKLNEAYWFIRMALFSVNNSGESVQPTHMQLDV